MSDQDDAGGADDAPRPRVIVAEAPDRQRTRTSEPLVPQVIATSETGRMAPAPMSHAAPAEAGPARRKRRGLAKKLGLAGLAAAFCGWLGVDLYLWIASAFEFSPGLGWAASAAVVAGSAAAAGLIAHELRSYLSLRSVTENQQRIASRTGDMRPADMQEAIRRAIAAIPADRETTAAIEAFQRKIRTHHSPAQQVELFSQTVMTPLDHRAESIVRRASARAFGISAISPTAITDALFFLACSVRMVREIAACYGHRPTALATAHLLRRLVVEAGKLGAVDLAATTLSQHIGGAVAERLATGAAESLYAAQRMARLGLVTMGLCRPIPFRPNEIPGILSSLIGNLFARTSDERRDG
ncbi:MAG: DUF697 domain-containing protein [Alphaproteobacteria bacterium]|nr:DUF697 domain-containing protein [Alphaproteobacteria bacterium]